MLNIEWWEYNNNFLNIGAIIRNAFLFFLIDNKNGTSFYTWNFCWIHEWIRRIERFLNCGFRCEKLQQLHRQITRNYNNGRQVSDAKRASRMQFHVRPVGKFCGVANYCNDVQDEIYKAETWQC